MLPVASNVMVADPGHIIAGLILACAAGFWLTAMIMDESILQFVEDSTTSSVRMSPGHTNAPVALLLELKIGLLLLLVQVYTGLAVLVVPDNWMVSHPHTGPTGTTLISGIGLTVIVIGKVFEQPPVVPVT